MKWKGRGVDFFLYQKLCLLVPDFGFSNRRWKKLDCDFLGLWTGYCFLEYIIQCILYSMNLWDVNYQI